MSEPLTYLSDCKYQELIELRERNAELGRGAVLMQEQRDSLWELNDELVAALTRYGRHESWCETWLLRPLEGCTCGLNQALASQQSREKP